MDKPSNVNLLEECLIRPQFPSSSPPPPPTSLPLTFLDIPWLFFPPSLPLFFYEFPFPTSHFTSILLPNLKHSLSLALQHFRPLAGTLSLPPSPRRPEITCGEADAISFTVADSDGDFNHLSSHSCQRDAKEFHKLVPKLPLPSREARDKIPLLAIQVTTFPNFGFSIGLAFHHVVADGRTFNNFMSVWSTLCSNMIGGDHSDDDDDDDDLEHWSCYDRTVIIDSHGLGSVFLKEWWKRASLLPMVSTKVDLCDKVRATFVMGLDNMERIKLWIVSSQCNKKSEPQSLHLSPYVLTCAFLWVCLVKAQEKEVLTNGNSLIDDMNYFGFVAGGLTRVGYPVPVTYFGNCVGFGQATATRGELLGEDGILVAARAIGGTVKRLDKAMLKGAEKWVSEWQALIGSGVHVMVSGSPKLDLYGRDFGWGTPKKLEEIEIDTTKAISLFESRDVKGGMEIGLVLPKPQMDDFTTIFKEGLKAL